MDPTSYRGCWHVVSRSLFMGYRPKSFPIKGVYRPRPVILHAASLHQGFPHCARFPTAATRRCVGRVSVPLERTILSDPLPVVGLVGRYPPNYLIGHKPLPKRKTIYWKSDATPPTHPVLLGLSAVYPRLWGTLLMYYSAVRHCPIAGTVRLACFRHAASVHPEP